MIITKANIKELQSTCKLLKKLNTENYNYSEEESVENFITSGQTYVAKKEDEILGVAQINSIEGSWELRAIVVKEKNQGIGTELIKHIESQAREEEITKLWCWSLARYAARGFYEAAGFSEIYLLKQQFYGEDCWFFGKVL